MSRHFTCALPSLLPQAVKSSIPSTKSKTPVTVLRRREAAYLSGRNGVTFLSL